MEHDRSAENPVGGKVVDVDMEIYDIEELHHNCTVQVLRNSVTGKVSVGWWPNEVEGG